LQQTSSPTFNFIQTIVFNLTWTCIQQNWSNCIQFHTKMLLISTRSFLYLKSSLLAKWKPQQKAIHLKSWLFTQWKTQQKATYFTNNVGNWHHTYICIWFIVKFWKNSRCFTFFLSLFIIETFYPLGLG